MVYEIIEERSAKDLPTTYKDIATLFRGILKTHKDKPEKH